MDKAALRRRVKCPDEVRYFIRILLCTLQHTIVAVPANGRGPGRKVKDDWEERVRGKVQTAERLLALGPPWASPHAASAVVTLAHNLVCKHCANQHQEFSQTAN